jgi:hypothetical protein
MLFVLEVGGREKNIYSGLTLLLDTVEFCIKESFKIKGIYLESQSTIFRLLMSGHTYFVLMVCQIYLKELHAMYWYGKARSAVSTRLILS